MQNRATPSPSGCPPHKADMRRRPDEARSSGQSRHRTDELTISVLDPIRTELFGLRGATSPETSWSPPHVNRLRSGRR
jgi:hypothetical protein